jgi:hypothetical protein
VIRMMFSTEAGPVIVLGIVEENVRLMRSGRPLHLDLGHFFKEAYGDHPDDLPAEGQFHLMIYHGQTHAAIIARLRSELAAQGHTIPAEYVEAADRLDDQLRAEGRL